MATISFENDHYGRKLSVEEALQGLRIIVRRFIGSGDDKRQIEERTGIVGVPVNKDMVAKIGERPVARMILVDGEPQLCSDGSVRPASRRLIYGNDVDIGKYELTIHPDQELVDGGDTIRFNNALPETSQTPIS